MLSVAVLVLHLLVGIRESVFTESLLCVEHHARCRSKRDMSDMVPACQVREQTTADVSLSSVPGTLISTQNVLSEFIDVHCL